ncbi:hypothetical protein ACUOAQ_30880, partial [Escherichia sp. SP-MK]
MSLLMPSRPIVINPDLAYSIGLNEAIALQQVNYWLKETTSGVERDGVRLRVDSDQNGNCSSHCSF